MLYLPVNEYNSQWQDFLAIQYEYLEKGRWQHCIVHTFMSVLMCINISPTFKKIGSKTVTKSDAENML
jgi:hypothetical protein